MRFALPILLVVFLVTSAVVAHADRIYLKSGWDFDVDKWWEEGSTLYYERFGGTISVPKSDVLRIERNGEVVDTKRQAPGEAVKYTPAQIAEREAAAKREDEARKEQQAARDRAQGLELQRRQAEAAERAANAAERPKVCKSVRDGGVMTSICY